MNDISLDIKRTFLSFAQNLFAENELLKWDEDIKKTKILIADKYAIDLKDIEKKRSIILSRGSYGWMRAGLGQKSQIFSMEEEIKGKKFSDVLRGSVTYMCIAQNGIVAEKIANILFSGLLVYKDQFSKNGINTIVSSNIGEEQILKSSSNIDLVSVPINISFESHKNISLGYDFYNLNLIDSLGYEYYQGTDFDIAGQELSFYGKLPTDDRTYSATYIKNITLEEITEVVTISGQTGFLNFKPYGFYYESGEIWTEIEIEL